jgi:SAM-dependent methyltransferase
MNGSVPLAEARPARERAFWDDHVPTLGECLRQYETGPDRNTSLMLDSLEPLQGKRVLDFGCGAGVTSAWLAARGAEVLGLDVSQASTGRARELAETLGLPAEFEAGATAVASLPEASFDRIAGRFVLHHVDCAELAPVLASLLRLEGWAAFVETFDSNPLLRFSRKFLVGRAGIARCGTEDERPLGATDLTTLEHAFGSLDQSAAEMRFLRMFDRQVLRYRWPAVSRGAGAVDDFLLHRLRLGTLSYHQVLVLGGRA